MPKLSPHRRSVLAGIGAALAPTGAARSGPDPVAPATLWAAPLAKRLGGGAPEPADLWVFGGAVGGPVLRLRQGEELRATLRNDTPRPLSVHWHGVRNVTGMDGVGGLSQPPVAPGATFDYRFTPPDAGTFLLRPSVLGGGSGEPAGRGLAGLLVVEEREPPPVDLDQPVLVRDWLVQPSGALAPFGSAQEAALAGRLGNRVTINGEDAPLGLRLAPGARVRLRLANGCNARVMRIRFDGLKAYVAAVDGQPTETFEPLRSTLPFAPGSRYDVVLDVPKEREATGRVVALIGDGLPLVEIAATDAPASDRGPIAALAPNRALPPEIKLQNALRRNVVLTGGATRAESGQVADPADPFAIWKVNGAKGSTAGPPLLSAKRGQPVVLGIHNQTGFVQPIHLHGHVFRLLHALDDGWEPYWLDTLQVPEGKTVHIAFVADNPGRWLLGSTVLERLDTGLWTWLEVT